MGDKRKTTTFACQFGRSFRSTRFIPRKMLFDVNKPPLFVLLFVCLSPSVHSLKKKLSTRKENERSFPSCRTQHKPNWPIIMKITKLAKLLLNLALREIRWCRDNDGAVTTGVGVHICGFEEIHLFCFLIIKWISQVSAICDPSCQSPLL